MNVVKTFYVCAKKCESIDEYSFLATELKNRGRTVKKSGSSPVLNAFGAQFPSLKADLTVCSRTVPEGPFWVPQALSCD